MNVFPHIKSAVNNWSYLNPFNKKIGYIGWVGHNNLGDEALFYAFQKLFSEGKILTYKEFPRLKKLNKLFISKVYSAVSVGGGTLINNSNFYENIASSQQNNIPTFTFGTGVRDPSYWDSIKKSENSLNIWVEYLKKSMFVGVRGPLSKRLLSEYGYKDSEIVGDLVLSMAKDMTDPKAQQKKIGINIGVSKGNVYGSEQEILDKVVSFSKILIDEGWDVTFFPVWTQDIEYIEEAVKKINKNIPIFKDYLSLDKTIKAMEACDLFVGEKLHSVILAMLVHTPSVMLGYRPKCFDFMESVDCLNFCVRTDKISETVLVDMVNELYGNIHMYQQKIADKVLYYKKLQFEKSLYIKEKIGYLGK